MFEVSIKSHFSAAHHLEGYRGGCEDQHGHNWDVEVCVCGEHLDEIGMLVDFRDIKKSLSSVLELLDHKDLNNIAEFKSENPTSERIAQYIYRRLAGVLESETRRIHSVYVHETPGARAGYWEEKTR